MSSAQSVEHLHTPDPRGWAPLTILFATVFIDLLGFGIVIPFLPMYAAHLQIGAVRIGVILSAYSLMQLIAAPILGRLSDIYGRRPIIMVGLLGSSLSYFIYGFAFSFGGLVLARAVHGVCAGTVSTAQAYVADITLEKDRARGMGVIGAAFGLGFVLGPAIGGSLGTESLRLPVFFAAALTLVNLIFAGIVLPEPERSNTAGSRRTSAAHPLIILSRQLSRSSMARLFAIAFLATFAMAMFETTFALMVPLIYGYRAAGVGALLAYAGLIQVITQGYLIGKIIKRINEKRLIQVGLGLFAIGMAPMASFGSGAMLLLLLAALSLGYGFANPAITSLISKRAESDLQGEALGINQSALALARVVGPIIAGLAYGLTGPAGAYVSGGLTAVIGLIIAGGIATGGTTPR
jgi:DHA1 family tetracycline resistance protein-like MFS transporter